MNFRLPDGFSRYGHSPSDHLSAHHARSRWSMSCGFILAASAWLRLRPCRLWVSRGGALSVARLWGICGRSRSAARCVAKQHGDRGCPAHDGHDAVRAHPQICPLVCHWLAPARHVRAGRLPPPHPSPRSPHTPKPSPPPYPACPFWSWAWAPPSPTSCMPTPTERTPGAKPTRRTQTWRQARTPGQTIPPHRFAQIGSPRRPQQRSTPQASAYPAARYAAQRTWRQRRPRRRRAPGHIPARQPWRVSGFTYGLP
jgi:hypothetical protein